MGKCLSIRSSRVKNEWVRNHAVAGLEANLRLEGLRIDAAEHLPNTCRRCVRLIDQIDGMVDGCNVDDKRTRTILENISSCMEELDDLIDRMIKLGATKQGGGGVCICLNVASAGKDAMKVEDDLERTEEELRKHLDSLVQATQLHTYSTRTSNKSFTAI